MKFSRADSRVRRVIKSDVSETVSIIRVVKCIKFNETDRYRLVSTDGYMDRLVNEATEILHPNSFSRDGGFMLSRTWQPILKQMRTAPRNQ